MTAKGARDAARTGAAAKSDSKSESQPIDWPPPFRPHRKLLAVSLVVFAIWVGFLLWMYFTQVKRPAPATRGTTAPALAQRGEDPVAGQAALLFRAEVP